VTSKFWQISENISETVQDTDIVTMEDYHVWLVEWYRYQRPWKFQLFETCLNLTFLKI